MKQILLVSLFENVWRTVWRICTLMLGCKGLTYITMTQNCIHPSTLWSHYLVINKQRSRTHVNIVHQLQILITQFLLIGEDNLALITL